VANTLDQHSAAGTARVENYQPAHWPPYLECVPGTINEVRLPVKETISSTGTALSGVRVGVDLGIIIVKGYYSSLKMLN